MRKLLASWLKLGKWWVLASVVKESN